MSGLICPDCNTVALIETKGCFSCPICGWSGKNPPRKIIDAETSTRLSNRSRRLLSLRMDNMLRYVRVDLNGDDETSSNAAFEIMDLLGLEEIQGSRHLQFFIEGKIDSRIDELSMIPGVQKVSVF